MFKVKKYHDIKCENCKTLINVDEYMKNKDYDKIGNKYIKFLADFNGACESIYDLRTLI